MPAIVSSWSLYCIIYLDLIFEQSIIYFYYYSHADPRNQSEKFNMAYLALRGSGSVNGVSRLHGEVSRHIFEPLFPKWPKTEVPVGYITNGVHMPTWDSKEADDVWTQCCGKDRWLGSGRRKGTWR